MLPAMVTEYGACRQDEICVDGELGEGMAYCVNKSEFEMMRHLSRSKKNGHRKNGHDKDGWITVGSNGKLGGKVARMVISGQEGRMPIEVGIMTLKAGVLGQEDGEMIGVEGGIIVRQERNCEGCFELSTGRMRDEIDVLETEAKVAFGGTAAAAAAGVVWLIVSG